MQKSGLDEFNAIIAVAAHKNFRAAAAELNLSPSALSHSIASLEQRLGVRLFNRTTRSVSLSEAGETFLARIRPALSEISAAIEEVNEFRTTPKGILKLNASEGAAKLILMPYIYEFLKKYPEMKVELATEGKFIDIVADGFDAGIRGRESVPQDMIAIPIGLQQLSFAVIGAPAYFKKNKMPKTPLDLLQHQCIRSRMASGSIYHWEFEKHSEEIKVDVKGNLTLDHHDLIIEAVLKGVGLGYTSEWGVRKYLKSGKLVRALKDWTPTYPGLCLYYPSRHHQTAGLKAFIELVKNFKN